MGGFRRLVLVAHLVLAATVGTNILVTPVTASDGGATVVDTITVEAPTNGGSLAVSDIGVFNPDGGTALIEPGTPSEESVTYTGVDAAVGSLLGLVRTAPRDHPAGAPISASTIPTPCEILDNPPTDTTIVPEACDAVDARVDALEEEVIQCTSGVLLECLPPVLDCTSGVLLECLPPIDACEDDFCGVIDDVCAATNGCDVWEPLPGVDVDATDAVLAVTPDHGDCTATSGGVFRSGRLIGGDGSFDCTANQHIIVTVKIVVKVKTAGVWDEFAVSAAAAESSCCIGAGASAACTPGSNFKYRVVTAGKAANSEGDVVHEDKDRGWDTVDRIQCPTGLTFVL